MDVERIWSWTPVCRLLSAFSRESFTFYSTRTARGGRASILDMGFFANALPWFQLVCVCSVSVRTIKVDLNELSYDDALLSSLSSILFLLSKVVLSTSIEPQSAEQKVSSLLRQRRQQQLLIEVKTLQLCTKITTTTHYSSQT